MGDIHKLADQLISQIAAGEVIERPVSVVKELVDNALDAGATKITVELEDAGKKLIRVTDNGVGMGKDDLLLSTKQHYTSKINQIDDLSALITLGFRGEALASIASVAEFTIRSRPKDAEHGLQLNPAGEVKPVGMPAGTVVEVADLFAKVPVRQKFLKSNPTELAQVTRLLENMSLVYPAIAFELKNQGKTVFIATGEGDQKSLLTRIWGADLVGKTLPVASEQPYISITGWVGQPGVGTSGKAVQSVFVNKRLVEETTVRSAMYAAFGSLLGRQEKPQYVLMLNIAPHLVDFNVHPQKKQVRFVNAHLVFETVSQAVRRAIEQFPFDRGYIVHEDSSIDQGVKVTGSSYWQDKPYVSDGGFALKGYDFRSRDEIGNQAIYQQQVTPMDLAAEGARPVFQVLNLFLIEELPDGLMIYDQHAVHERVLYERLVQAFLDEGEEQLVQNLLVPLTVPLPADAKAIILEAQPLLAKLGFRFSEVSDGIALSGVPHGFAGHDFARLFCDYASDLAEKGELDPSPISTIDNQTHRRLSYLACRSAIMAGDHLFEAEIKKLLADYRATKVNFTCPHGRPVQTKITRSELEHLFRR